MASKAKAKAKARPAKVAAKKPATKKPAVKSAKPAKAPEKSAATKVPGKAAPAKSAAPVAVKAAPVVAKAPPVAAPAQATASSGTAMLRKSRIPPRLTIRSPVGADELKAKIGALATQTAQIRALKRSLSRSFYEIGTILVDIRDRRLYEAKGYGSFEAFVEREIELGKQLSLKLVRIVGTFLREAAVAIGLDRATAAIAAIDGESETTQTTTPTAPTSPGLMRSPIPFHKQ